MAIISLNKVKEIGEKNKETHIIDLGKYVDKKLEGVCIPIKIKNFEETLKIKQDFKIKNEKLTIEFKPFTKMPKQFKEMYMNDASYTPNMTENTYFQLFKVDKDITKIELMNYRQRLFNILIHLDMDYVLENGKTMWEDSNIQKNDYNSLVNLFNGIIEHEHHLDILDIIIDSIKNGLTDEKDIIASVYKYNLKKFVEGLNEEERKEFFEAYDSIVKKENKDESNSDE